MSRESKPYWCVVVTSTNPMTPHASSAHGHWSTWQKAADFAMKINKSVPDVIAMVLRQRPAMIKEVNAFHHPQS